jgi:basic membrane lipoprotein Med (substrate-binding protein (PBP1-ABC) superfamily)
MRRLSRFIHLAAALAATCALAATGPSTAQQPLRIGFVYVSPIGDAGWTFQHDQGPSARSWRTWPKAPTQSG